MHWSALVAAIGERPGDADCTDRIQAVGVLHDGPLERFHFIFYVCALERDVRNDLTDPFDDLRIYITRFHPGFGALRRFILLIIEFPIIQVVEQSRELHDIFISLFVLADREGILPHAIYMPPIMP